MMDFGILRSVMACLIMFNLMGCGGGGSAVKEPTIPDVPGLKTPGMIGQRADAQALLNTWNPPAYTDLAAIPTTGGADYTGHLYGELSDNSGDVTGSVVGSLALEAGFSANGITFGGKATNFFDRENKGMTGTLAISGGRLDRAGNPSDDATVVGVRVTGKLTDAANNIHDFGVSLEGDFLGSAYNAIGGNAIGGVKVDGVDRDFDGGFIAER